MEYISSGSIPVPPEWQPNEIDGWLEKDYKDYPLVVQRATERAHRIVAALDHVHNKPIYGERDFTYEAPLVVELSPLGTELKKLDLLFTNPANPEGIVYDDDLASLVFTEYEFMDRDMDRLTAAMHKYVRDAHALYLPALQGEMWPEMEQWQRFWMTYGASHSERSTERQQYDVDLWFKHGYIDYPEVAQLAGKRAHKIISVLYHMLLDNQFGESGFTYAAPQAIELSPLGTEVKNLIFLFTNPANPKDTANNDDIANFVITMYSGAHGNIDQLVANMRQYVHDAHGLYMPVLELDMWPELLQLQRFWAIYGAVQMKRFSEPV